MLSTDNNKDDELFSESTPAYPEKPWSSRHSRYASEAQAKSESLPGLLQLKIIVLRSSLTYFIHNMTCVGYKSMLYLLRMQALFLNFLKGGIPPTAKAVGFLPGFS